MTPTLLRQVDVADRLGITKQRVAQLIRDGRLDTRTPHGTRLVTLASLTRFARNRAASPLPHGRAK